MSNSLGFRLPVSTGLDGVGFVNPIPLPAFDSALSRLHLIRRSERFTNWDRVSQEQGDLENSGAIFEATRAFSEDSSESLVVKDHGLNYGGAGFTIAVAWQPPIPDDSIRRLFQTSDFSDSGTRGINLRLAASGADFGMSARIYTEDGRANASSTGRSRLPDNAPFWTLVSWDGTDTLRLYAPGVGADVDGDLDTGQDGVAPLANADLVLATSQTPSQSQTTNIGLWAYAQYGRGLDGAEMEAEYEKLKSWGDALGVTIA